MITWLTRSAPGPSACILRAKSAISPWCSTLVNLLGLHSRRRTQMRIRTESCLFRNRILYRRTDIPAMAGIKGIGKQHSDCQNPVCQFGNTKSAMNTHHIPALIPTALTQALPGPAPRKNPVENNNSPVTMSHGSKKLKPPRKRAMGMTTTNAARPTAASASKSLPGYFASLHQPNESCSHGGRGSAHARVPFLISPYSP